MSSVCSSKDVNYDLPFKRFQTGIHSGKKCTPAIFFILVDKGYKVFGYYKFPQPISGLKSRIVYL